MPKSRKVWNMKGCSRKSCIRGGKKCNCSLWGGRRTKSWRGGAPALGGDFNLAYTGNSDSTSSSVPNNPYLAYTGKQAGGANNPFLAYTGQAGGANNPFLAYTGQAGGCLPCLRGGGRRKKQRGGSFLSPASLTPIPVTNNVVPAPLEGTAWSATNWPGQVNDVNATQLGLNTYPDPQADRLLFQERIGTQFPIQTVGQAGGRKTRRRRYRNSKSKKGYKKVQRGGISGVVSQIGSDLGNAYNTMRGFPSSPDPLPYQDQYPPQDNLAYLKVGNFLK